MRILTTTRRKIDALKELIKQIQQELGSVLVDDLSNDQVVLGKRENLRLNVKDHHCLC